MQIGSALLLLALGLASVPAEAADRITWLHPEFPPSYIGAGELAGQGYLDRQLAILQSKLPGLPQSTVTASLSRVWHEMARTDGICFLGASPTAERLKVALFSKRGTLTPIIRLAMRAEQVERIHPYLNAEGEVDLDKLKSASDLTGAYTYFKRSTHADFTTVDFRIAGSSAAQPYYAACSKGSMGKKAIARIDAVLDEPANWHEFIAPLKEWFPQTDYERTDRGVE